MNRLNALELWSIGGDNAAVIWCSNRKKLEEEEHRYFYGNDNYQFASLCPQVFRFIFLYTYIYIFLLLTFTPLTNGFLYEMKVSAQRRVCVCANCS